MVSRAEVAIRAVLIGITLLGVLLAFIAKGTPGPGLLLAAAGVVVLARRMSKPRRLRDEGGLEHERRLRSAALERAVDDDHRRVNDEHLRYRPVDMGRDNGSDSGSRFE